MNDAKANKSERLSAFVFEEEHTCYNLQRAKPISYVEFDVKVNGVDGKAFLDSGCTFNAISSKFAKSTGFSLSRE